MTTPPSIDPLSLRRYRKQLEASLCVDSLAFFFDRAWPFMEPTRALLPSVAIDGMCAAGQAVGDGRLKRLAVATCPGTSKSLFWSVAFPAWLELRTHGRARIMVGSYAWAFALRDATRCRDLVQCDWFQGLIAALGDSWEIREDANQKSDWWITETGRRLITSVEGKSTGERCTWQIIDEPLSAESIYSTAYKAEAVRWVFEILTTRLEDQRTDPRVLVAQRLCKEDPIGEAERRGWTMLVLPAVLGPNEIGCILLDDNGVEIWRDARKPGEPIVALLDIPTLKWIEKEIGPTAYAAQYLQNPHDDSASIFKREWFHRRWSELPAKFDRVVVSLDASFKAGSSSDYAVIQVWGALGGDRYLIEQWRRQAGYMETAAAMRDVRSRYPMAKALVEEAANGHAIIDALRRELPGLIAVKPEGGKVARAYTVEPVCASGAIVLPSIAPWVSAWIDEVAGFGPDAKHDDQVDSMVYALRELQGSSSVMRMLALGRM